MSYIVKQKIGNVTYVMEATSYWDKEKKQSRQKRKVLGKIDPITGKMVPTKGNKVSTTSDYGNQYFLNELSKKLKLDQLLEASFGDDYKKILSLANYILSENSSLHLFEQWYSGVEKPYDLQNITSQKISELLKKIGISDDKIFNFFELWTSQNDHKKGIFYDVSSISSYSEQIEKVEWGYNRDKELLPQVNIGMLYSKETELPLWYDITQGSIADVSTLERIVDFNKELGIKKDITYIMDKGFFSFNNLEKVLKDQNIIIPLSYNTNLSKELLSKSKDAINNPESMFMLDENLYYFKEIKEKIKEKEYTFFIIRDKERYEQKTTLFYKKIFKIEEYFENNKFEDLKIMKEELKIMAKSYSKFFKISKDLILTKNVENIEKAKLKLGTTILFTNIKDIDKKTIIKEYRSKDRVEKMFHSIKNNLDFKRMKIHSDNTMKGKFFIVFIALIMDIHILNVKIKSKKKKVKKATRKEIIKELRKIKKVHFKESFDQITDISRTAKDIFKEFGIDIPKNIVKK